MKLELLSGDAIEVFSVTVEIPINPNVLTKDMRKQLNKNTKLAILKPDTNIAIKNNIVIVDSTRTIGYITHINEKSVFAEIYDAYYLKNLYNLFIEPILIDASEDNIFVIFECYINRDDDKALKNSEVSMNEFGENNKDSKEMFKDTVYNAISSALATTYNECIHTIYNLINDRLLNKTWVNRPITKQDVNIKSDASTNGLEDIAKPKKVIKSKEQEDFENSFYI